MDENVKEKDSIDVKEAIKQAIAEVKAEQVEKEASEIDVKALVAEILAEKEVKKEVEVKAIKVASTVITVKNTPFKQFESKEQAERWAVSFIPKSALDRFDNVKALTTYSNIGTAADGGNLDTEDVKGILADSVAKYPSYVEDTLQVPVINSTASFIDRTQTASAYIIGEGVAITESKPQWTQRSLTLKKIACLAPITGELMRFGTLADIGSEVLDSCARSISEKKQYLIFGDADGTADTTDGSMTSVPNTMVAVDPSAAVYTVVGNWSALNNTDISKIVYQTASWSQSSKNAWYCNRNMGGTLEGLARALGGNVYLTQTSQGVVPMLFNFPIKFVDKMPGTFVEDEIGLLFGDLSATIATATNGQTYIDMSKDFYFDQDVVSMRVIQHYGQSVYHPGTETAQSGIVAVKFSAIS